MSFCSKIPLKTVTSRLGLDRGSRSSIFLKNKFILRSLFVPTNHSPFKGKKLRRTQSIVNQKSMSSYISRFSPASLSSRDFRSVIVPTF
ncbi:hypothetical protein CH378_12790 [Leptospira kmetyi]|uniref:Uncharacterized protein n=1 Tax=Leptospira kmetyi TaxID=408139 RepID=A0ABX4NBD0_9LEPT|nr:hypothetical protein CH378_12790 [Leptospira kmetyi]